MQTKLLAATFTLLLAMLVIHAAAQQKPSEDTTVRPAASIGADALPTYNRRLKANIRPAGYDGVNLDHDRFTVTAAHRSLHQLGHNHRDRARRDDTCCRHDEATGACIANKFDGLEGCTEPITLDNGGNSGP